TKVGEVANTAAPDPVSSVNAAARFALEGVASHVATLVPKPVTLASGRPVQFVSTPDVGVPSSGAMSVGVSANTSAPEPVSSLMTPFNCKDVVAANCDSGFAVSPTPLGRSPSAMAAAVGRPLAYLRY